MSVICVSCNDVGCAVCRLAAAEAECVRLRARLLELEKNCAQLLAEQKTFTLIENAKLDLWRAEIADRKNNNHRERILAVAAGIFARMEVEGSAEEDAGAALHDANVLVREWEAQFPAPDTESSKGEP